MASNIVRTTYDKRNFENFLLNDNVYKTLISDTLDPFILTAYKGYIQNDIDKGIIVNDRTYFNQIKYWNDLHKNLEFSPDFESNLRFDKNGDVVMEKYSPPPFENPPTKTCWDGSVILTNENCPSPPLPPPQAQPPPPPQAQAPAPMSASVQYPNFYNLYNMTTFTNPKAHYNETQIRDYITKILNSNFSIDDLNLRISRVSNNNYRTWKYFHDKTLSNINKYYPSLLSDFKSIYTNATSSPAPAPKPAPAARPCPDRAPAAGRPCWFQGQWRWS